jgi:hypothetical protein
MTQVRPSKTLKSTLLALAIAVLVPTAAVGAVHIDPGGGNKDYGGIPVDSKPNPKPTTNGTGTSTNGSGSNSGAVYVPCKDLPQGCPTPTSLKDNRAQAAKTAVATAAQVANEYSSWLINRFGNRTVTN